MSKVKFEAAKELIQSKHYDEARAILRTIDHPMAAEWLDKIDNIAPKRRGSRRWLAVLLLIIVIGAGGAVLYTQRERLASVLAPAATATLGEVAALPSETSLPTFTAAPTDAPTAAPTESATNPATEAAVVAEEPTESPIPQPCLYSNDSIQLIKQFLDTGNIASNTNRSALNLVLPNLKNQHQRFQQLPVPDCLKAVNTSIDTGMQFVEWGFQAFQKNQDPLAQTYLARASQSFNEAYNQSVTLGPLADPDPRMADTKSLWGY